MAKFFGVVLTITRTFIVASALAMAVALPMWSSSAVAQNDIRRSKEAGGDTLVTRTYDDKTGKLLEVDKEMIIRDPNNNTKYWTKNTTKKYDQGTRPPYETTSSEQEYYDPYGDSGRWVRKSIRTRRTYKKTKDRNTLDSGGVTVGRKAGRDLVIEVKEEKEVVGLDANGVPIYKRTRVKTWGDGRVKNEAWYEAWDAKTRKWTPESVFEHLKKIAREKLKEEAALKDKRIRKEDIKKNKDKPEVTNKPRRQDRRRPPKPKAEEDRIVEADEGGMLVGKSLARARQPSDVWLGKWSATSIYPQANHQNSWWFIVSWSGGKYRLQTHISGPETMKITKISATNLTFRFHDPLDSRIDITLQSRRTFSGTIFQPNNNKKLQRGIVMGNRKDPGPAPPVAKAEPKKDCKPGGGLVGAMNCVTERIEGAGGSGAKIPDSASSTDPNAGTTTTSVKNTDGSRTVTRTDRDGKVLSKKKVGKSPASASSTDRKTGVTTKSVRNPDGTRTVTKTDKDGNILSRERVGKALSE